MKHFCRILFFVLFFLLSVSPAFSQGYFKTNCQVTYELRHDGRVLVDQQITLTNLVADKYASDHLLRLNGEISQLQAWDNQGPLKIETTTQEGETVAKLFFNEKVLGEGKTFSFHFSYLLAGILNKNGEVWEANLPPFPKSDEEITGDLTLKVPKDFGPLAYLTPGDFQARGDDVFRYYLFAKETLAENNLSAAFGDFQLFSFRLNYHLYNPHEVPGKTTVAFPPDTAFQRVYYQKIDPAPLNVEKDLDGNWLGTYLLEPQQKINILAEGSVKIFSQPQSFYPSPHQETVNQSLLAQKYWETQDPQINQLAKDLGSVEKIYQYVVNTLDYSYQRVHENAPRLGAAQALSDPDQAICTEFTDLFVTLCRAAGIPAREINGYAYTNNPRLKPLGLVMDILHAWPEYWDNNKKAWIPVDPTWSKTTLGRDYFHHFDLNHFAFVIHGTNSEEPLPAGSYKTGTETRRDIEIEFSDYQPSEELPLEVEFIFPNRFFQNYQPPVIKIKNPGPTARYQLSFKLETQNVELEPSFANPQILAILPPWSEKEISVPLVRPSLFKFGIGQLKLRLPGKESAENFPLESLVWPQVISIILIALLPFILFLPGKIIWSFYRRRKAKSGLRTKV